MINIHELADRKAQNHTFSNYIYNNLHFKRKYNLNNTEVIRNFNGIYPSALLCFENLITNVGTIGLTIKDEITNYVAADVICYKKQNIKYEASN